MLIEIVLDRKWKTQNYIRFSEDQQGGPIRCRPVYLHEGSVEAMEIDTPIDELPDDGTEYTLTGIKLTIQPIFSITEVEVPEES